jgi:predicted acylesterase/phospholipase RssA
MDMRRLKPRAVRARASDSKIKRINLALQGGGAHGAFAWGVLDRLIEDGRAGGYLMMDMATRLFSPYQLNPWNLNPLREVLERHIDFAALRRHSAIKLFLAATNVETCKVRIFECADISADAVLASACLPFMFQAVQIDGQFYWDGGYIGNPAIYPLIYRCEASEAAASPDDVHTQVLWRSIRAPIVARTGDLAGAESLARDALALARHTEEPCCRPMRCATWPAFFIWPAAWTKHARRWATR